jgi:hypothetical protein
MSAIPDKDALVQAIRKNVPEELLNQKIWLAYYYEKNNDGTYSKPPVKGYSVDPNKPSYAFDEVIQDGYPGIKINSSNRLVAFDVDDKKAKLGEETFSFDKIPAKLREFLTGSNTYTELSPSKCGVRSLFLTDSKEDLPGRANLIKELCLGGELFVNSGYVTITGDKLFGTDVMHITKEEIQQFYNSNGHKPTAVDIFRTDGNKSIPASLPKLNDVLYAIDCCKLDQSAIVKRAYKTSLVLPGPSSRIGCPRPCGCRPPTSPYYSCHSYGHSGRRQTSSFPSSRTSSFSLNGIPGRYFSGHL